MKLLKKIVLVVTICAMAVGGGLGLVGCKKQDTIAVIAKGETHAFWQAVKSGADAAGEKYGYKVSFRGPESEGSESITSQKEMVSSAVSNKNTKALVIATIGAGFGDYLKTAKEKKMPVVEFDSGIHTKADIPADSPIVSAVATSNELAASLAAEKFYDASLKALIAAGPYHVGIIQHDNSATGIDRAKGFEDKLKALATADGKIANLTVTKEVKDNTAGAYKTGLDALKTAGAKAIFMSNEGVVKECYAAVTTNKDTYKDLIFCGYDAGTNQIDWIKDEGATFAKLVGSVAQDSYQIGYQAVEQAAKALKGETVTKNVSISGAWYNKANLAEMMEKNLVYLG